MDSVGRVDDQMEGRTRRLTRVYRFLSVQCHADRFHPRSASNGQPGHPINSSAADHSNAAKRFAFNTAMWLASWSSVVDGRIAVGESALDESGSPIVAPSQSIRSSVHAEIRMWDVCLSVCMSEEESRSAMSRRCCPSRSSNRLIVELEAARKDRR